jgi:hypothetical protein
VASETLCNTHTVATTHHSVQNIGLPPSEATYHVESVRILQHSRGLTHLPLQVTLAKCDEIRPECSPVRELGASDIPIIGGFLITYERRVMKVAVCLVSRRSWSCERIELFRLDERALKTAWPGVWRWSIDSSDSAKTKL